MRDYILLKSLRNRWAIRNPSSRIRECKYPCNNHFLDNVPVTLEMRLMLTPMMAVVFVWVVLTGIPSGMRKAG